MKKQKTGSNAELVTKQNEQLKQYAEEVNKLHTNIATQESLCFDHGKIALKLAHQAGRILLKARELVPHGGWEKWVAENVISVGLRSCQNYMKLAFAIDHREDVIQNRTKNGGKTQLVSLLDEVKNLREAYRVIGIIKNGFRKTDFTEKQPSPDTIKKNNPKLYAETEKKVRSEMFGDARSIMKDNKDAKWDILAWTVVDGRPTIRDKATLNCLGDFVEYIAIRSHNELRHHDETVNRAGAVLSELLKAIIQASQSVIPEIQVAPEVKIADIVPYFSFEPNRQSAEVVEPALA
jgi:hypothetical protein